MGALDGRVRLPRRIGVALPTIPHVVVLTCRNAGCSAVLGSQDRPAEWTGNLLEDVRHLSTGCVALWCKRCGVASEYLTVMDRSA